MTYATILARIDRAVEVQTQHVRHQIAGAALCVVGVVGVLFLLMTPGPLLISMSIVAALAGLAYGATRLFLASRFGPNLHDVGAKRVGQPLHGITYDTLDGALRPLLIHAGFPGSGPDGQAIVCTWFEGEDKQGRPLLRAEVTNAEGDTIPNLALPAEAHAVLYLWHFPLGRWTAHRSRWNDQTIDGLPTSAHTRLAWQTSPTAHQGKTMHDITRELTHRLHAIEAELDRDAGLFHLIHAISLGALGFMVSAVIATLHSTSSAHAAWVVGLGTFLPSLAYFAWPAPYRLLRENMSTGPVYYKHHVRNMEDLEPLVHTIMRPLVEAAGVAPTNPRVGVVLHTRMVGTDRRAPKRLEVYADGYRFPGLTKEAELVLTLITCIGGRWGASLRDLSVRIPAPQPSAHARLRWQAHILAHPDRIDMG